jgi:hypothetical protein
VRPRAGARRESAGPGHDGAPAVATLSRPACSRADDRRRGIAITRFLGLGQLEIAGAIVLSDAAQTTKAADVIARLSAQRREILICLAPGQALGIRAALNVESVEIQAPLSRLLGETPWPHCSRVRVSAGAGLIAREGGQPLVRGSRSGYHLAWCGAIIVVCLRIGISDIYHLVCWPRSC